MGKQSFPAARRETPGALHPSGNLRFEAVKNESPTARIDLPVQGEAGGALNGHGMVQVWGGTTGPWVPLWEEPENMGVSHASCGAPGGSQVKAGCRHSTETSNLSLSSGALRTGPGGKKGGF